MRVLVISHNVFSKTSSMGKTLSKYFECWDTDDIAQLYIHSEVPTDDSVCTNYYRITDLDAIKLIAPFTKAGRRYKHNDIQKNISESRTDSGLVAEIYQGGRKRTPLIYLARDTYWSICRWNNAELNKWADEFKPEVVFLASGDYSFIYKIALNICKRRKLPLIVSCYDDYYLNNMNDSSIIGKLRQKLFMRVVNKTMKYASGIVTVCESMSEAYHELFNKVTCTLYTPATATNFKYNKNANKISYFGSLGLKRHEQLVALGLALKQANSINPDCGLPECIDVYSTESRPHILDLLTPENGISFHHAVDTETMLGIYNDCMAVLHVEAFDEVIIKRIRFSVSTKIAESLRGGPCLLAYGPETVASIDYVEKNGVAFVIHQGDDLSAKLIEFAENYAMRSNIVGKARMLAEQNHDSTNNYHKLYDFMEGALKDKQ